MTNHSTTHRDLHGERFAATTVNTATSVTSTTGRVLLPLLAAGVATLALVPASHALGTQGQSAQGLSSGIPSMISKAGGVKGQRAVTGTPLDTTWLNGDLFTGFKPGPNGTAATAITVLRFAGDVVEALVRTPTGQVTQTELHPRQLVGVEFVQALCQPKGTSCFAIRYRIAGVVQDRSRNTMARHSSNRGIWLYDLEYNAAESPDEERWRDVCAPPQGPDTTRSSGGLFLDDRIHPDGSWSRGYMFSCESGVAAKCARTWGYKPWATLTSDSGEKVSLRPLHQACVRAARADYCGDGVSHTLDGTVIDIADRHGFNLIENAPGFRPEAEFGPGGAVSIARTRWQIGEVDRGDHLELASCQRPKTSATQDAGEALIAVWSHPAPSR